MSGSAEEFAAERVCSVLDAAAQFRLRQKANRIRNKIDVHGRDETLFQEIATALGYKENKLPFTLLTQRLPLRLLRENVEDCEALLFGAAGFLEAADLDIYKKSAREYVRQLWDRWWPHRDDLQRLILPAKAWHLSGTRPLNHPQRRLAALANSRARMAASSASVRKEQRRRSERLLSGARTSVLEFSLHTYVQSLTEGDGVDR